MPKLRHNAVPSYRLHKQSGQAIVTLSGRYFLLGPINSAASRREYSRLIGEWIANDRRLPGGTGGGDRPAAPTVNELTFEHFVSPAVITRRSSALTSSCTIYAFAVSPW